VSTHKEKMPKEVVARGSTRFEPYSQSPRNSESPRNAQSPRNERGSEGGGDRGERGKPSSSQQGSRSSSSSSHQNKGQQERGGQQAGGQEGGKEPTEETNVARIAGRQKQVAYCYYYFYPCQYLSYFYSYHSCYWYHYY
jgi:hypothetical protein